MTMFSFFILGGLILIISGVLQTLVRPPKKNELGLQRFINRGTMWAFFCISVGTLAILVGAKIIPIGPIGF